MKTEINIYVLMAILLIHWLADFVLQTDQQATKKSTSNYYLTAHVATYSGVWFVAFLILVAITDGFTWTQQGVGLIFVFPTVTFICHWITDYFTSRLNTYLHKKGSIHYFFVSIGFDQILHYVQLIITFQILTQWK